ncbi:TetR/AcrR family transcriptional regulator, partial [Mycobacterium sp.]|uniref:TetR/AcrR family transcriptional regulator n=1 Tax=Mycobacterium sp. TaxID=1785 RepID=UPI003F9D1D48
MTATTAGKNSESSSAGRRRTRANGEASRQRILDAATEVATERGYEGTTISLVSKKSGLPPT